MSFWPYNLCVSRLLHFTLGRGSRNACSRARFFAAVHTAARIYDSVRKGILTWKKQEKT